MKAKDKYAEEFVGSTPKEGEKLGDRHRKVLGIFSKHKLERILDVGCGDGNFSILLKKACKAKEVYGIEISESGVKSAKKNGVKAFQLDIDEEDFPFEGQYFDAIFAGEVIEHLFDPDHFLDETHRVLKPKGILVLSTPNLASIHNRIALLFGYQPFSIVVSLNNQAGHLLTAAKGATPDHIRHFTLRSLKELLKIHKFEILEVKGSCAMLPENTRFGRIVKAVDRVVTVFPNWSYRSVIK